MSINYNMIYSPLIMESVSHPEGNEDAFLKLGEIDVYDNNLKSIITVKTEDFVKVVTDAMFKISNEYKFFYQYFGALFTKVNTRNLILDDSIKSMVFCKD